MYAKVLCHPPLGQATAVPAGSPSVTFTVFVETNASPTRELEVQLWHNIGTSQDWEGTSFAELEDPSDLVFIEAEPKAGVRRQCFRLELEGKPQDKDLVSFTIRFRSGPNEPWKWIRDQSSVTDGQLCYQKLNSQGPERELADYFKNFNTEITVQKEKPQNKAGVYSLLTRIDAAEGEESGYTSYRLGIPAGFSRYFCLVRLWAPWLAPRHGRVKFQVDKDTMMCAFLLNDGTHIVLLALSGIGDTICFFRSDDEGNIIIHGRNDSEKDGTGRVVVAIGTTFEEACAAAMFEARKVVVAHFGGNDDWGNSANEEIAALEKDIKPQWLEEWYDGFAYCTWNGLGQNLTEQKIFDALASLRKHDINITNLIIDDNWQSLDHPGEGQNARRWMEFEANKEGFPKGLAHTTSTLRQQNPNLKHIAVWHALLGYWGAVSPDGKIAKEYETTQVKKVPGATGDSWTVVSADDVKRFYEDFYGFLSSAGIDSVKTDAQFQLDEITSAPARRALTKPYQDAWVVAMLRHFSARAISCMSQAPQIIYHSQIPNNRPRILVRNSDDFFPDVEDSHPWHVFCNAYNMLLTQHLNALPDWDMFQTSHPWAAFHAAARCVSGGPIYFTDIPGKHDVDLIHQMTAQTTRGDTVILRPSVLGRATHPYAAYDELKLLKVGTYNGFARTGTSILGVFNVSQTQLSEIVTLSDLYGTEEGTYVVRAHTTGQISKPMSLKKPGFNFVVLDLPVKGYEILSAYSVYGPYSKEDKKEEVYVANLGLIGKMTGAAAIVNTSISSDQNWTVRFWTSLKALGTLGVYITDLDKRSIEDDFMVLIGGTPIPMHCVKMGKETNVFEVDVARAWKETDQKPGWSNEIALEVFIK
ncbi:glycoside hydrolase [Rhizodiscina lignyota]|uniref:Glycoside hydrolase n=1 Tax=Rhizodiscina lignyota TaxID=1504668 RepID=A0A9P4IQ09_9PEZI|nr:glycoside hydrolase [Rhizodiscina lignyota]